MKKNYFGIFVIVAVLPGALCFAGTGNSKSKFHVPPARSSENARSILVSPAFTPHFFVGGSGGPTVPSVAGSTPRMGFGFEAGYEFEAPFSLGAYFLRSSNGENVRGMSETLGLSFYGIQSDYRLTHLPGFSVGLRVGLASYGVSNDLASASTEPFTFGPRVAYDYRFKPNWTFGANAGVLFGLSTSGRPASDAFQLFSFLAALKYWI